MRRTLLCAALAAASIAFAAGPTQGQGGARIILYQEDNFRGAQLEVTGEVPRVKQMHFDDRVSSVRVVSGTWELCSDDAFRGQCITVRRDEPRLDRVGMDDMVSSLRPVADRRDARDDRRDDRRGDRRDDRMAGAGDLVVYEDINYQGQSRGISGEVANVGGGWNDRISSLRVRAGTWELCQDENFRGRCIRVDRDVRSLVDMGFNDEITSIRRIR